MSKNMEDLEIRPVRKEDLPTVTKLFREVGFPLNTREVTLAFNLDPRNYMLAVDSEGCCVGVCGGLRTNSGLSGIGAYAVQEGWRGRGIGSTLWQALTAFLEGTVLTLAAEDHNIPMYAKSGFKPLYRLHLSAGPLNKFAVQPPAQSSFTIVDAGSIPFEQLQDYDTAIHKHPRPEVLEHWILKAPDSTALAAVDNDTEKVVGYGVIRRDGPDLHINPLYANSDDIARALVAKMLVNCKDGENLNMATVVDNLDARNLAQDLGIKVRLDVSVLITDTDFFGNKVPPKAAYSAMSSSTFDYI